ncbi:MAG: hypothetical protein QE272_08395 [Nevskia sp.]|nr:hypothetical protein [Nevskia sp.]
MQSDLPRWVQITEAIAPPIIALVAAAIAGAISYRQWRTAKDKLKLDLFDRRLAMYHAAIRLIQTVEVGADGSEDWLLEDLATLRNAVWLLGSDAAAFIEHEIQLPLDRYFSIIRTLSKPTPPDVDRADLNAQAVA